MEEIYLLMFAMPTSKLTPFKAQAIPFEAKHIADWDGAVTPEERTASVWLYDALFSRNANLVKLMLDMGAKVNTRLDLTYFATEADRSPDDGWIPLAEWSPLAVATWALAYDRGGLRIEDEINFPTDYGIIGMLLDRGAIPHGQLLLTFEEGNWEATKQPSFVRLEQALLDRLGSGQPAPDMVMTTEEQAYEQRHGFESDVVPYSPDHPRHIWLHRAILHQRWDAVESWCAQKGVLGTSEYHEDLFADHWRKRLKIPEGTSLADDEMKAFNSLHGALLNDDESMYRKEVLAVIGLLHSEKYLGPIVRKGVKAVLPHVVRDCQAWVEDLLHRRPLNSFVLTKTEEEVYQRSAKNGTVNTVVADYLRQMEHAILVKYMPKTLDPSLPRARL